MKIKILFLTIIPTAFLMTISGQKAEPNRIKFARGGTNATANGVLKTGEEEDFVVAAKAGQKISLKVVSVPKGNIFDFTVAGNGFDFKTGADSYSNLTFAAPETGDYLVTVRRRPLNKLAKAKFILTVIIK